MAAFLKHLHMTLALLTFISFFVRGIWMLRQSPPLQQHWVKIVPHVVDTLLLVSALALLAVLSYSPVAHPWLQTKILALVVYIGLGTLAFKHPNPTARLLGWIAALLVFGYIVSVAFYKTPWGLLGAAVG